MGDEYMWESEDNSNSYTITLDDSEAYTINSSMNPSSYITTTTVTLPNESPDFVVMGDIIQQPTNGERINVTEIIHEQKLQIEALTEMIGEMVKTKNFDIEWNLEKRVEQKKFLNKLGEDPNDL